ncbi:hypothetical protein E1B28_003153 [Marasmius oreades]|uniref:SigF-like NTF2-like domain-containing protein n=1 Tax=Marasmius oreades TaxID=181124 RepID=A0A9P7RLC2_9AGAR|nr:uncharacterized protein E1B28_003153 [Marasmius oreades]KAG7085602.1 hypothetical protein E1B28_003153 [Marasmius oreades]
MENPQNEIAKVVSLLTTSASPEIQELAAERYVTTDVGFRHPVCRVNPGPGSRDALLGIYQWYRVMSPTIETRVDNVVYDKQNNVIFLEVQQKFHIRLSPFRPTWSKLIVRLSLREINGLHYIAFQEDFYHPDDFLNLLIPPLAPFLRMALTGASLASNAYASVAQGLGYWSPTSRKSPSGVGDEGRGLYDGNRTD